MIRIIFFEDNGVLFGFRCEGHAPQELGSRGENLLCAAVSSLVQTVHSFAAFQGSLQREVKEQGLIEAIWKDPQLVHQPLQILEFGIILLRKGNETALEIQYESSKEH